MSNCIIYCTVPNEFNANLIASSLVEENLAACINILPSVTSVYKWDGIAQNNTEMLMMIKTREEKFEAVEAKIKQLHEYSLPEIIAVPIIKGSDEYQNWIIEETK